MGWFSKFVSNPVSAIGDVVDKTVHEVSNATSSIDDFVNDEIPGGWITVGLVAAGCYYSPEIGAYLSADGAVVGATEAEAATTLGLTEGGTVGATGAGATTTGTGITTGGTGLTTAGSTGTGLTTAGSTGTGLQATTAGGLADMGGAQGLVSNATTSNLATMGGGQGLTTAGTGLTTGTVGAGGTALSGLTSGLATDATANSVIGAGGAGVNADTLAGDLGKNLSTIVTDPNKVLTNTSTVTGGGTNLSDLVTPNNALIAKSILDAISGEKIGDAITDSAKTQQAAYEASKGDLSGLFTAQKGYQRPYMTTGANALNNINSLSTGDYTNYDYQGNAIGTGTGSGYLQHQFDKNDLASGLAPNYDFMLQQGQMANQRAANIGGGALSGNTLQGLNKYTQDYAGNAYQNAFTNYQNQRNNIYNTLSNIAGIGQGATNQLAKTSDTYGTNLTNLNVGNAAAQAAAQVAAAQTRGNTLSNLGNTGVLATLLNQKTSVP